MSWFFPCVFESSSPVGTLSTSERKVPSLLVTVFFMNTDESEPSENKRNEIMSVDDEGIKSSKLLYLQRVGDASLPSKLSESSSGGKILII